MRTSSGPPANDVNPAAVRMTTYRWTGVIPYVPNAADLQSVAIEYFDDARRVEGAVRGVAGRKV